MNCVPPLPLSCVIWRLTRSSPHLTSHQLIDTLKGIQAVSVTHSYRFTLTVLVTDREIILPDVGSHDEMYR